MIKRFFLNKTFAYDKQITVLPETVVSSEYRLRCNYRLKRHDEICPKYNILKTNRIRKQDSKFFGEYCTKYSMG